MKKIISLSFGDDMIAETADYILSNYSSPDETAVVFGGRRPAYFLQKELFRKTRKSFFPPRTFSGDEFMGYVAGKNFSFSRISELDACHMIYNTAKSYRPGISSPGRGFSWFLPAARAILSLIERIDLEKTDEQSLKNIQDLAGLEFDIPEHLNRLIHSLSGIRNAFHAGLESKNTLTRGLVYLKASEAIKSAGLEEFRDIIFCGAYYLHRTELEVLETLLSRDKAVLIFQRDENKWPVMEELSRKLGINIPARETPDARKEAKISACSDLHAQVCAAREALEESNKENTVLVLPEADTLIPLLNEIRELKTECNISMGYPVKRSILYSLIFGILNAQKTARGNMYYARDYLRLISHPFPKNMEISAGPGLTRIVIHKIEEALRGMENTGLAGRMFVSLEEIESSRQLAGIIRKAAEEHDASAESAPGGIISRVHDIFFRRWENLITFSDFAKAVEELINVLISKMDFTGRPLESAAAERLARIAEELKNSSFNSEEFRREDIFRIFEDYYSEAKIAFTGTPLKGLQVLGFLETRCIKFQNVIFLDLNEGVLPHSEPYEPLIPAEILNKAGLKDQARDEEIQRYHFKRLIGAAENVYLLYRSDEKSEKSRLIEEIIWEKEKKLKRVEPAGFQIAGFKTCDITPGYGESIEKTCSVVEFLKKMTFSASSLNVYMNCPLKFCYKYVYGLEEAENLLAEPEAAEIGSFAHELLEKTFRQFINSRPVIDGGFMEYFESYFNGFFKRRFSKRMRADGFMLKELIIRRLRAFLEKEKARKVKRLLFLEEKLSGKISLAEAEIKLTAVLDRVDLMEDESIFITDYKTGMKDAAPSKQVKNNPVIKERSEIKKKIKSFQLPLYISLLQDVFPEKTINAGFYNLRIQEITPFFNESELPSAGEMLAGFMDTARNILYEILRPDIPFEADRENPRHCAYCSYQNICG